MIVGVVDDSSLPPRAFAGQWEVCMFLCDSYVCMCVHAYKERAKAMRV